MNIISKLFQTGNINNEKMAIIDGEYSITYEELLSATMNLSRKLSNEGIKKGDKVVVLIPMSAKLYITLSAIWTLGGEPVFFDVFAGKKYIENCCNIIKPDAIIVNNKSNILTLTNKTLRKIPTKFNYKEMDFRRNTNRKYEDLSEETPALLTFTSGSTGAPKCVIRTHSLLINQYNALVNNLNYSKSITDLGILPIFTLANLAAGNLTIIPQTNVNNMKKLKTKILVNQIYHHSVNKLTCSPTIIKKIYNYCLSHNERLESIKILYLGGGPVYPSLLKNLKNVFPNAKIYIVYGSSEAEPIAHIEWKQSLLNLIEKESCLLGGYLIPEVQVKIIKPNYISKSSKITLEDLQSLETEIGEIIVSGNHVVKHYLDKQHDLENKFYIDDKVWHRTGDLGLFKENCLLLAGRMNNLVEKDNTTIFPFMVETYLNIKYNIDRSSYFMYNNKTLLVLEENCHIDNFKDLEWAKIDKIIKVKKLPMDKKHSAKVNVSELKRILSKKGEI